VPSIPYPHSSSSYCYFRQWVPVAHLITSIYVSFFASLPLPFRMWDGFLANFCFYILTCFCPLLLGCECTLLACFYAYILTYLSFAPQEVSICCLLVSILISSDLSLSFLSRQWVPTASLLLSLYSYLSPSFYSLESKCLLLTCFGSYILTCFSFLLFRKWVAIAYSLWFYLLTCLSLSAL
jgi:hypothetical protein